MCERLFNRLFYGSVLVVIICACAKINTPTGGPKDRKPPVVVNSVPINGARNFKGKQVEVLFDEYVVLDNINEKFVVSPPVKMKPTVSTRGKGVVVQFDEKLKDSTTYTLNFQDAIKDLNEGNILQNFQFVLSTGPVKDSLSVTGNAYNAFNLEIPEKTSVLLYTDLSDTAVTKHLPDYISYVDQTGYFRIDNIRPGTYRLYALKDADNSRTYNNTDEEVAFLDSNIVVTPEKNFIPLPPVVKDTSVVEKKIKREQITKKEINKKEINKERPDDKGVNIKPETGNDTTGIKKEPEVLNGRYKLFQFIATKKTHYLVSSARENKYQMLYILSLPPDTMKFDFSIPGVDRNNYLLEPSKNRDTLKVWLTDSTLYSQSLIKALIKYPFTDSLKILGYKQDTIPMRFFIPKAAKAPKVKKHALELENNIQSGSLKPGGIIVFKSKTPLKTPDTSRIKLYEIVQKDRIGVPYNLIKDSARTDKYYLQSKLSEEKKYLLIADKGSFSNIYNDRSDSVGLKFSIKDPESYCKLTMYIKNYEGNRIIQLLDKTEKLVAENFMTKDGNVVFSLLDPGTYRLRVIYDLNGDRKWTTGDFESHRQPEPVSYYPAELELRAGYDLEFTSDHAWDISIKNFKDQKLVIKKKVNDQKKGNDQQKGTNQKKGNTIR